MTTLMNGMSNQAFSAFELNLVLEQILESKLFNQAHRMLRGSEIKEIRPVL